MKGEASARTGDKRQRNRSGQGAGRYARGSDEENKSCRTEKGVRRAGRAKAGPLFSPLNSLPFARTRRGRRAAALCAMSGHTRNSIQAHVGGVFVQCYPLGHSISRVRSAMRLETDAMRCFTSLRLVSSRRDSLRFASRRCSLRGVSLNRIPIVARVETGRISFPRGGKQSGQSRRVYNETHPRG